MSEQLGGQEGGGLIRGAWPILAVAAIACVGAGWLAAKIVGFPVYPGWQGTFSQQPTHRAWLGAIAVVVLVAVCLRVGMTVASFAGSRVAGALAGLSLLGFSIRGGTMGSVMQAADSPAIFWSLAAEAALLGLAVAGAFLLAERVKGDQPPRHNGDLLLTALVQATLFVVLVLLLGKSYQKGQGTMTVFASAIFATLGTKTVTGSHWKHAWSIPLVVAVIGYAINAVNSMGLETATLRNWGSGFAMPLPVDYAALGPAGIVLGELLAREKPDEEAALERATA